MDPDRKLVQATLLEDGRYHAAQIYLAGARVPVTVLEGCEIDLGSVFPEA